METKSKAKAIQIAKNPVIVTVTDVAKPHIVVTKLKAVKKMTVKPDAIAKAKQIRELAAKLETEKTLNHEKLAADYVKEQSLLRSLFDYLYFAIVLRIL